MRKTCVNLLEHRVMLKGNKDPLGDPPVLKQYTFNITTKQIVCYSGIPIDLFGSE